jgi:hypothetical protein
VLASLLLVPAIAIVIATPGVSDEGCPSPRQVTEALSARVPGAIAAAGTSGGPGTLHLAVSSVAAGGIRLQITDASGEPILVRVLPPARGHAADCPALAETVALIVERYLHEIGYEAPPLPPPPERPPPVAATAPVVPSVATPAVNAWQIGLTADGRAGNVGGSDGAGGLSATFERTGGRFPFGLRVGAAFAARQSLQVQGTGDHGALYRLPFRLSAFLALAVGPGHLEPGLDAGLDLLLVSLTSEGSTLGGPHLAPFGGVLVGYALSLARHVYARATARGGIARPITFRLVTPNEMPLVWDTPRAYTEFGVELGVSFP